MLDLNDPSLLSGSAPINGSYLPGTRVFSVTNSATGAELARVADLGIAKPLTRPTAHKRLGPRAPPRTAQRYFAVDTT